MDPDPRSPRSGDARPLTLYCVPHAGGGAAAYARWRRSLPTTVDLVPVELPGHGSRLAEQPILQLDVLVRHLADRMTAGNDRRIALLGHSFGALVTFEIARRLTAAGAPPDILLVCGRNGPACASPGPAPYHLPDHAFLTAIRRLGGIPMELDDHPDLVQAYLPALRADLRMTDEYRRGEGPPLDVPIVAYGGQDDVLTQRSGLLGWQQETTATFELVVLPGDHFFIRTEVFIRTLRRRLDRLMAEAAP